MKNSHDKPFIQPEKAEKKHIQAEKRKNDVHKANQNTQGRIVSPHLPLLFCNGLFLRRNVRLTIDGYVYVSAIWLDVSHSSLQPKKVSLNMMMSKSLCYLQRCFIDLCQNKNTFHQRPGKSETCFSIRTIYVIMIYEINHIWTVEMKWKWRNDRRSERNLCNCVRKPENNSGSNPFEVLNFFQASLRNYPKYTLFILIVSCHWRKLLISNKKEKCTRQTIRLKNPKL